MFALPYSPLLLFLTKSRIINCPTKYAIDIKVKFTNEAVDLRSKVGDNKSEVLASEASAINAVATITQTMKIITLFDNVELERLNDAFPFFLALPLAWLIGVVPLYYCEMTSVAFIPSRKQTVKQ